VVSKKRRRSQLARATAERQRSRRAQRLARRRRLRVVATAVAVLVALAALATWIVLHARGAESVRATGVDYAAVIEPPQRVATTTEGAR
jgi:hypothetical protein